ncbi:aquaporin TIP1-2-like [Punica granatum]|uniref:Uncharacterized protein n=2 Tax=Punica granatum TaxID=22663 RepID=A0A218X5X1_PUNGR|nr:aquaporin TIP1-2-like [Punica granatum]OWM80357.1 hypothetical protein CDL15_Pgr019637 [Punica granatum]PKH47758.1 hypothetical protein CRG98_050450 [Punica granatum]
MEAGDNLASSSGAHPADSSRTIEKSEAASTVCRNKSCSSRFLECIGAHEIFSSELWRASLTELVATAALMFTLTTSIISCLESGETNPKLLVPMAVFINAFLFLLVTVPLTGGHMNPIFSFIALLKGVITLSRASAYILAQCIGSVIGFLAIKSVMSHEAAQKFSLGGCALNGLGPGTALILEFICTFLVLFIGVTVAFDERRSKELGLVVVCTVVAAAMAVAVFVSVTVTGNAQYGGVGLNPARCLGAALAEGRGLWDGHWVFWIGPLLGCVVYSAISSNMPKEGSVPVDEEHSILKLGQDSCFGSPANVRTLVSV